MVEQVYNEVNMQNDNVKMSAKMIAEWLCKMTMWRRVHNENIKPSAQNEDGRPIVENGGGRMVWSFFHVLCGMLLDDETFCQNFTLTCM
jgi:hypothetical protein